VSATSTSKPSVRPLTHSESLVWTGQQLAGEQPVYNMAFGLYLDDLQIDPFRRAFETLVHRFPPLQATVQSGASATELVYSIPDRGELPVHDFTTEADADERARAWMSNRATRPFEVADRLYDSALLIIGRQRCIWYINQHHIITDAWSCRLLLEAMDAQYRNTLERGSILPALPMPDPGRAPATATHSQTLESRAYWRDLYNSVPEQAPLLFSRPKDGFRCASQRLQFELNNAQMKALQHTARDRFPALSAQISLFTTFAVLLTALVSRLSRRQRIAFETPSMNRHSAADRATPGLFIELFPFVVDIDTQSTFVDLGKQILDLIPGFVKHGRTGASMPGGSPACDTLLNFIPFSVGEFNGKSVPADFVHPGYSDAAHSIRLQVWDLQGDGGLTIMLDLNKEVIAEANQQTVQDHLKGLLDAFLADPDAAVAQIPLLNPSQRHRLLTDFNSTTGAPLPTQPVIRTIFDRARANPDSLALSCEGLEQTYGALTTRIDRVAGQLLQLGVSRGDRVCINLPRCPALIEVIFGLLRLGATYVPIDPDYPLHRRLLIIEATQAKLLIQQPDEAERDSDETSGCRVVSPGDLHNCRQITHSQLPDVSTLKLDDIAYILFTSGSTGSPKGVPVSQRGLAVYIEWANRRYGDNGPVSMPLLSSIAFDLTVTSLFLPLISGGTLFIYPSSSNDFDNALLRAVEDNRVNAIKLTPAHLSLLQQFDVQRSHLHTLIVGGEQLTTALAASVSQKFGSDLRIINEYGPTEAVVGCMIHRYQARGDRPLGNDSAVPIGRPADHTRIYLLNTAGQAVAPGVIGEIHVHRVGAPTGYLSADGSGAQAFVADVQDPTQTMYRTGDLGRFDGDGNLVYVGRSDDQIKVAGHRIEIGEVETLLGKHPAIRDCAVALSEAPASQPSFSGRCSACGIGDDTPGITLDNHGLCQLCRDFSAQAPRIDTFFRQPGDLKNAIAARACEKRGDFDCMVLLSGGKDSTYALYQVVAMGFKVYAFTLDNGYTSDQARSNIQRVIDDLGIDHEFATTEHMAEIFRDSLSRFSNVCQGCFKTIYTLSIRRADELGIPVLVTGLSRGQLFETRLNLGLFKGDRSNREIDAAVLEARKAYHRRPDAVTRCLGRADFDDDALFERVQLLDFYRYWSAPLSEMLDFLNTRAPWIRPDDTGRSSNCLINDVGIHVHNYERGYHNYALPYSWDVRLGQKDRAQAVEELHDDIDPVRVQSILNELDYRPEKLHRPGTRTLIAFYRADTTLDAADLRNFLAAQLPDWSVPVRFVAVEQLPLTIHGKIDRRALLKGLSPVSSGAPYRLPESDAEIAVCELWQELLTTPRVGADDNFFELGGNSLLALEFMNQISQRYQVTLPLDLVFTNPAATTLAQELEQALLTQIDQLSDEDVRLALDDEGAGLG
jgi:amino acid adenylation domain-containing protein